MSKNMKKFPKQLVTGTRDTVVTPKDFNRLAELLDNDFEHIELEDYSHIDLIWARDVAEKIFGPATEFLNNKK